MPGANRVATTFLSAGLLFGRAAFAQQPAGESPPKPALSALQECVAAAEAGDKPGARAAADRAEELYEQLIAARPADPNARVGLARVKSQCRIRFANFMTQGRLVGESNELLEEALALDSTHWSARLTLALNHYHTPSFLGRTDDAIWHFERLLAQQGERADYPELAWPYAYLGDLYRRVGRDQDALAVWRRGARLFPDEPLLKERLQKGGGASEAAATPAPAAPTSLASEPEAATGLSVAPAGDADAPAPIYALAPLVVEASSYRMDEAQTGTALSRLDVYTTPGGTADLLQVFQTVPGTTRASEGSDLYVRGGDPAESPVFVDGGRLFYAGTFETLHGGLFGVLDPSVLRKAYFSSGGFSARYGNALSGVLDVETDARPTAPSWRAGVNLVQAGATARAPLGRGAGIWASVRGTEATLLLDLHGEGDLFPRSPRALEAIAGVMAEPRPDVELRGIALAETDEATRRLSAAGHHGPFQYHGDTRLAVLALRALPSDGRRSLRTSASVTRRSTGFSFGVLDVERTDRSVNLRVDADLAAATARRVRFGAEGTLMQAEQGGRVPTSGQVGPGAPAAAMAEPRQDAWHAGVYLESETALSPALGLIAGVRADRLPDEDVWTADPRVALAYRAGDWTMRLSGGAFHQGRWRIRYRLPDGGAPAGVPRRATHVAAGVERDAEPALRLELYLKEYDRYATAGEGPPVRAGQAAGADVLLRWSRSEPLTGWISYSFLDGRVELEDGSTVRSAVDVTHSLTTVTKLAVASAWELGATARYATGRPYTAVRGATGTAAGEPGRPIYGPIYGERLPDYLRLDARITRLVPRRTGILVLYLEMLNLLDRENVMAYTYDAAYRERQPVASFFADRTLVVGFELQR